MLGAVHGPGRGDGDLAGSDKAKSELIFQSYPLYCQV
jgi:hypothetical protein